MKVTSRKECSLRSRTTTGLWHRWIVLDSTGTLSLKLECTLYSMYIQERTERAHRAVPVRLSVWLYS